MTNMILIILKKVPKPRIVKATIEVDIRMEMVAIIKFHSISKWNWPKKFLNLKINITVIHLKH